LTRSHIAEYYSETPTSVSRVLGSETLVRRRGAGKRVSSEYGDVLQGGLGDRPEDQTFLDVRFVNSLAF
jgi:hypothetical protein